MPLRLSRRTFLELAGLGMAAAALPSCGERRGTGTASPRRPNVLLIVADDMGFSDAGCYGGDIQTPNLDRLAARGLRFTQCYSTARCWPSRASILTGYYPHQVRRDKVPGVPSGTGGTRPQWARLLPEMLRPLGYRNYHSGKWHVDGKPLRNGFDRSYWLEDTDRHFSPKVHFEDDRPLPAVQPGTDYYSTTDIAEHSIRCLKEHASRYADRAFFQYLAFVVPHFPIQAPAEDVARYRGRYREGWDVLRWRRWERQREMGLVNCGLSARDGKAAAWESLSDVEKDAWGARMAVHAAMVDRMDREIGRVIDQVRAMGVLDNTVVLFVSDNGASAERILRGDGHDPSAPPGSARTFQCIETGWANLANAPFRRHKIWVHEGGISSPLIVHWPAGIAVCGELRRDVCHFIDLVPTIVELAGGRVPHEWGGKPIPPPPGLSLAPALGRDGTVYHEALWWYHEGNRAVRVGDMKLVAEGAKGPWELYDLATDRCESNELAERRPEKAKELADRWARMTDDIFRLAKADLLAAGV
jgi:arylsulfatase